MSDFIGRATVEDINNNEVCIDNNETNLGRTIGKYSGQTTRIWDATSSDCAGNSADQRFCCCNNFDGLQTPRSGQPTDHDKKRPISEAQGEDDKEVASQRCLCRDDAVVPNFDINGVQDGADSSRRIDGCSTSSENELEDMSCTSSCSDCNELCSTSTALPDDVHERRFSDSFTSFEFVADRLVLRTFTILETARMAEDGRICDLGFCPKNCAVANLMNKTFAAYGYPSKQFNEREPKYLQTTDSRMKTRVVPRTRPPKAVRRELRGWWVDELLRHAISWNLLHSYPLDIARRVMLEKKASVLQWMMEALVSSPADIGME